MKHHFVPAFYLRNWTSQGGELTEFSRPWDALFARRAPATATGYERDLYKFDRLPDEMVQYLETQFLGPNDHLASIALSKLISSGRRGLSIAEQSSFVRFLLGFRIRHPDPFNELRERILNYALTPDHATSEAYKEVRRPVDPPTLEEWIAAQSPEIHDRICVRLAQAAMDNERLGQRIIRMIWRVIDVKASNDLLMTSDWPLENRLSLADGYIALPLLPRFIFVAAYQHSTLDHLSGSTPKRLVHLMNRHSVRLARRYVWAVDERQRPFVEKHFGLDAVVPPFFPTLAPRRGDRDKIER
jgi:hypothetical protein